jgi:hypothetical protein
MHQQLLIDNKLADHPGIKSSIWPSGQQLGIFTSMLVGNKGTITADNQDRLQHWFAGEGGDSLESHIEVIPKSKDKGRGVVVTIAQRVLSQNSLSTIDLLIDSAASCNDLSMQLFATGDPGTNTYWLKQISTAVHIDCDSNCCSVTSQSRHSQEVQTSVVTYHTWDRKLCLGCSMLKHNSAQ